MLFVLFCFFCSTKKKFVTKNRFSKQTYNIKRTKKNMMVSEKFCNILVHVSLRHIYHMTRAVQTMVGIIVVVGALTCCAEWYLKAAQMNIQQSSIQNLMLYKFKLSHNMVKVTKNICCAKGKDAVVYSTVIKWFKKFCSGPQWSGQVS